MFFDIIHFHTMFSPEKPSQSVFPDSTLQQLSNFKTAREKLTTTDFHFKSMLKLLMLGLLTLIPDLVENSGVLIDNKHLKTIAGLLSYQISLNDLLDFQHSGRDDIGEVIATASAKEQLAYQHLLELLNQTCKPEQIKLVQNCIAEIITIETWAAAKRDWSIQDAIEYRNLVNAVSNVLVTTVTLKFPQQIVDKLESDSEHPSIEGIRAKYDWILTNQYDNRLERTILIMHNLAMAGQIDDDRFGVEIDSVLNIHSVALVAKEYFQDDSKVEQELNRLKTQYLSAARQLGLSPIAVTGIDFAQGQLMQRSMAWLTHSRVSHIPVWKRLMQRRAQTGKWPFQLGDNHTSVGLRERLYVAGEI